jgi:uncharacterized protein YndB with AHSA1/START domain
MTNDELPGDSVRVSALVQADVAASFRLFTEETDSWWKRGSRFRIAGSNHGTLHLEPHLSGRLFESFDTGGVTRVVRTGRVRIWEPPTRLAFEWRAVQCAPDEVTEVEVTFEPSATATRVTLTHRGWSTLRPEHPARRDLGPMDVFWGELMSSLSELALRSQ